MYFGAKANTVISAKLPSKMERHHTDGIIVKGWEDDNSPILVEHGSVGNSMEEYWANQTVSYAEMETGSLDDYDNDYEYDDDDDDDGDDNVDDDYDDEPIDYGEEELYLKPGALLSLDTGNSDDDEDSGEYDDADDDGDDYENEDEDEPDHNSDYEDIMLRKYMTEHVTSADIDDDTSFAQEDTYNEENPHHRGVADDLLGITGRLKYDSDSNDSELENVRKVFPSGVANGLDEVHKHSLPRKKNETKKSLNVVQSKRLPAKSSGLQGKKKQAGKGRTAFNAEMKHKIWLLSVVERKRLEEEEIMKKIEKAELKRKKFKEALLERARAKQLVQAQEGTSAAVPDEMPSKPVKTKKRKPPPKPSVTDECKQDIPDTTVEEARLCEQDETRFQTSKQTAAERKRFKRHHKKMLEALKLKKEEEEKKLLDLLEKDERMKEKMRKRNEKMIRNRQDKQSREDDAPVAAGSGVSAVRASRSQGGEGVDNIPKKPRRVRSVSASDKDDLSVPTDPATKEGRIHKLKRAITTGPVVHETANEGSSEDGEDDPAAKEKRLERIKMRQAKVAAHLNAIAEQRKLAADKTRLQEERMKKRVELRSQRVLQEGIERKLMAKEDKYTNPGNVGEVMVTKPGVAGVESDMPKKKITPEMAEAISNRLQAKQGKVKEGAEAIAAYKPAARDFDDWKKKNSVPPGGRVFCMTGWYPCVKTALLDRGWYYNPDPTSAFFDMKWTLRSSDIGLETLQNFQLTNHFLKNIALTTKVGLLKSLRQLVWLADMSPNDIIPRGFDLTNSHEIQEYVDDFRIQQAQGLLMGLYSRVTGLPRPVRMKKVVARTPRAQPDESSQEASQENDEGEVIAEVPPAIVDVDKFVVNSAVFAACCAVLTRFLKPFYTDCLDDGPQIDDNYEVSPLEWELIEGYDLYSPAKLPKDRPEAIDEFLQDKKDSDTAYVNATGKQREAAIAANRHQKMFRRYDDRSRQEAEVSIKVTIPLGQEGLTLVHTLLSRCDVVNGNQSTLNGKGEGVKNMWIVKPAAKSRGRGIATFCNLKKLLDYVELGRTGKNTITSSHWIVQKYMENGLTIGNHKLDMRQWVLVTDWNPLTIYFYHEFYCRFSVEEYTTSDEAMENSYVHLVNNSIGKTSERFNETFLAENGEEVVGFMWSHDQMKNYMHHMNGSDDKFMEMKNRMKDIAVWSLMCGSDAIEHRKNSWELYGFDFMLDDEFKPWLIEINSSPACDYSTSITERYVKGALVELLNVVLDVREWETQPKKTRGKKPDTGGWENIYSGPFVETPSASFGTDMTVKGEPMKVPKKKNPINAFGVYSPTKAESNQEQGQADVPPAPVSIGLSKGIKAKRQVLDASSTVTAKNVLVKFDPNGDNSDDEETTGLNSKAIRVPKPPAQSAPQKSIKVQGSTDVKSLSISAVEMHGGPLEMSQQPERVLTASRGGDFHDFDDSDSDDDTEESKARRLLRRAARDSKDIPVVKEAQVSNKTSKKVQNVPGGTTVIPIKTFSMDL